jgi:hypothetical protein
VIDKPEHMPDRLALLSDANAAKNLSMGLLAGRENPPYVALNKSTQLLDGEGTRLNTKPLRDLIDDVMHLYRDDVRTKADAWLAPRIHATLRLTRREAADARLWNFIALSVAPDYVVWRHLPATGKDGLPPMVAAARFSGAHYTQAFSRLWWAAELFRDGDKYDPVVVACGNQDMLNTVLRLDIIDHRPTAQALVRLVEKGTAGKGREANALAVVANTAASTLMYDIFAVDDEWDGSILQEWIHEGESAPPVSRRSLPDGPPDGPVPEKAVDTLARYFEELFVDAKVRGKITEGN